jgi:O-antigen biosynthesis protein WbqP
MKRSLDIALVTVGTPVVLPVVLVCMTIVRLTSPGPAIFRQTRIGIDMEPFTCYKLRTMHVETPDAPSHETSVSAITPVGKWLRRLKLDELPQLWNIIRGEMSLVGPRPCLPSQCELIEARRQRGLYQIRPGITGVSQVAGIDMADPERLAESDARYLSDMSAATDLKLILATVLGAGGGDRVRPESS